MIPSNSLATTWQIRRLGFNSWWDASNLLGNNTSPANNAAISNAYDLGVNSNSLIQLAGGYQPTYITNAINGRSVMRFDGSNYLQASTLTGNSVASSFTATAVCTTATTDFDKARLIATTGGTGGGFAMGINVDKLTLNIQGVTDCTTPFLSFTENVPFVFTVVYTRNGSAGTVDFWFNGILFDSFTDVGASSNSTDPIKLGAYDSTQEYWQGDIMCAGVAYRVFSTDELTILHNLLKAWANI